MRVTSLQSARAAAEQVPSPPTDFIRFTPGDCALLIGPAALLLKRLEAVRIAGLRPALLCTGVNDAASLPSGLRALTGQLADLSGWMGAFRARLHTANGPADLTPLSFHADGHFDWVLDFTGSKPPGLGVAPLGHYSLVPDDYPALKQALLEIAQRLRDGFEKPRYFHLNADLCAHQRQSVAGCSACLAACAAGAISFGKQSAQIEAHLCQGCGACALVCPSGAVRHAYPGTSTQLARLRAALEAWRQLEGGPAGLWIVEDETDPPSPGWLTWPVREAASLGLEFWLAALALGAQRVALAVGQGPEMSRAALASQVELGRSLLTGLGLPSALGLADTRAALAELPGLPPLPPFDLPGSDDKRSLLFAAIDALAAGVATLPASIPLSAGPLGEIRVDPAKCTLCSACVGICPAEALSVIGPLTQLAFTEERCLQCGLCVNTCPEKAVSLSPRLLTSRTARKRPRVLVEADMFACSACGMPFATQAMMRRSRALMADHPMFQGEQARLMDLCPACRQKAMVGIAI
ncbi:MAG: 4Fe-4S dicluster domain-containing protein [Thiobacillaceae bacterium]